MGRELQKKKKRSSTATVKMKPKSKRVNPLGNALIAANWNQSETLTQNYRRLGLASRLNSATGGIEKLRPGATSKTSTVNKLAIANAFPTTIEPTEARVERDPETGKILRVIHKKQKANPLNDLLNSDDEDEDEFEGFEAEQREENPIVRQLEEQAARIPEKKERLQSEREIEWLERLVGKWGVDYGKMARDKRLNPMQQTAKDIQRRVEKWKGLGEEEIAA